MLTRKNVENLHTVMAILAFFEQISGKVCAYFWPLTLSALSHMLHFVRTVSIRQAYACLRRLKHIVMKRFKIREKFCLSKALLKIAGEEEGCIPPPWIRH